MPFLSSVIVDTQQDSLITPMDFARMVLDILGRALERQPRS